MFVVREVKITDLPPFQRLRADVYTEKGYLKPQNLKDGRDIDQYDEFARHVGVTLPTGEAVGTLRIIPADHHVPLQLETLCGIKPDPITTSVEASRFVVHPSVRKGVVTFGLIRWCISTCTANGIKKIYAVVEDGLYQNFLAIGLPFSQIGEKVWAYETWNIPISVPVAEMLPGVRRADEDRPLKIAPFLESSPCEGVISDDMLRSV